MTKTGGSSAYDDPIISGKKLSDAYQLLDSAGFADGLDFFIDFPGWLWESAISKTTRMTFDGGFPIGYTIDDVYLSDINRFIYGSIPYSRNHSWWVSETIGAVAGLTEPLYASVEETTDWIDLDLDTQVFTLRQVDYLGFDSRSPLVLLEQPSISTYAGTSSIADNLSVLYASGGLNDSFTRITSGSYQTSYSGGGQYATIDSITDYTVNNGGTGVYSRAKSDYTSLGSDPGVAEAYVMYEAEGSFDQKSLAAAVEIGVTVQDANVPSYNTEAYFRIKGGGDNAPSGAFLSGFPLQLGPSYSNRALAVASSLYVRADTNATTNQYPAIVSSAPTSTTVRYFHATFTNSEIASGRVGSISTLNAATSYTTSSDYRLKTNVEAMTDSVSRLMALNPIKFNWKSDLSGDKIDGFLAHEVQDVVPEAITGYKDAIDGNGEPDYQGIDQAKLAPLIVSALQEAISRIENLETVTRGLGE
jgi:hypothetical protein